MSSRSRRWSLSAVVGWLQAGSTRRPAQQGRGAVGRRRRPPPRRRSLTTSTTPIGEAQDRPRGRCEGSPLTAAEDIKKLNDKFATLKKLTDDHATALKTERDKTDAEKAKPWRARSRSRRLAPRPGPVLDVWLPRLTDLPASDADASGAGNGHWQPRFRRRREAPRRQRTATTQGRPERARSSRRPSEPGVQARQAAKVVDAGLGFDRRPAGPVRQPVVIPPSM